MNSIESRIANGARSRGETLRLVIDGIDAATKKKIYISISNTHFDVYHVEKILSVKAYSWFILKKCYVKDLTLFLEFDDSKISFSSKDVDKAYFEILDILPRILKRSELFAAGISYSQINSFPTPISAILRLRQRVKYSHDQSQMKCVNCIENAITFSPTEIDLDKLENPLKSIRLFADILPLLQTMKSVVFQTCPATHDGYKEAMDISSDSGELEHIEANGQVTNSFEAFMKNLTMNKYTKVKSLTFNDSKLAEQHMELILNYIKEKQLISLGLNNAIQSKSMTYFFFNFLSDNSIKCLKYLSLNNTPGMNLYALLPEISNITYLSMENCSLDLNKTLGKFSKMKFNNLTGLNLSKNQCKDPLATGLVMPPNLRILSVDNVDWGDGCLISFFNMVEENFKENGLKLSIIHASASRGEWSRVFNLIPTLSFVDFKSLVWDRNPIREVLFEFLLKQKSLDFVSFGECFGEQDTTNINNLCDFIKKARIKSLAVEGGEEVCLKKSISHIIDAILKREPLDFLSIRCSKSSDKGIEEMKQLISSNAAPLVLVMDGAEPERSKSILDFLNKAIDFQSECCVSFPTDDLNYLVKLRRITDAQYNEIKERFKSKEGSGDSQFEGPFSIYVEPKAQHFPKYLPNEMYQKEFPQSPRIPTSPFRSQLSPFRQQVSPFRFQMKTQPIASPNKAAAKNETPAKNAAKEQPKQAPKEPENEKKKRKEEKKPDGEEHKRLFELYNSPNKRRKPNDHPNTYDPEDAAHPEQLSSKRRKQKPATIDSDEFVSNEKQKHTRSRRNRTKEPEVIIQKKNETVELTDDSSAILWDDECNFSNVAAVSSQAAKSTTDQNKEIGSISGDELDLDFDDKNKGKEQNPKTMIVIKSKKNATEAPKGRVARLDPSDSIAQILVTKRNPLPKVSPKVEEKSSAGSDIPMKEKVEDVVPVKQHAVPPINSSNKSSDFSSDNEIMDAALETIDKSEIHPPEPKVEEEKAKEEPEPKPKPEPEPEPEPVKVDVVKSISSSSKQENVSEKKSSSHRRKSSNPESKSSSVKEKKRHRHRSKAEEFNWRFPLSKIHAPSPFQELQTLFSLERNIEEFSKIPHYSQKC